MVESSATGGGDFGVGQSHHANTATSNRTTTTISLRIAHAVDSGFTELQYELIRFAADLRIEHGQRAAIFGVA
jgi:hypothetical protein